MADRISKPKYAGAILIAVAVALILVFSSVTREMMKSENAECGQICGINMETNGAACPHQNNLPIQSYAGFSISFIVFGLGISLVLKSRIPGGEILSEQAFKKAIEALNEDEKKIYHLLREGGGTAFQSKLIEKAGFTKVKVSRLLDKLEGRGMVERRRRGMTNIILMRQGNVLEAPGLGGL